MRVPLLVALLFLACAPAAAEAPPEFRQLPGVDIGVFGCASGEIHVYRSEAELRNALETIVPTSPPERVHAGCLAARERFTRTLASARIRWDREALVLLQDYYGTGMAKATLELTVPKKGVVEARIVWTVPPPPVTPDVAIRRFAFAIDRSLVRHLIVSGRDPEKRMIDLASPREPRFERRPKVPPQVVP